MFGLFKKKKDDWAEIFEAEQTKFFSETLPVFQAVAQSLPEKYSHLRDRFHERLLRGCRPNRVNSGENVYVFLIDQLSHKNYETEKNNYLIQNIRIFSKAENKWETLELHIHNNIPTSFIFSTFNWDFDTTQIDVSKIREFQYGNPEHIKWSNIIGDVPNEHNKNVDLISGFEIEVDNEAYFVIKEFGDGDYLAVNESKEVYGLIHGKNITEKLFNSLAEFYIALNKKQFDVEQYYDSRT
jgi:hypothetical protein